MYEMPTIVKNIPSNKLAWQWKRLTSMSDRTETQLWKNRKGSMTKNYHGKSSIHSIKFMFSSYQRRQKIFKVYK